MHWIQPSCSAGPIFSMVPSSCSYISSCCHFMAIVPPLLLPKPSNNAMDFFWTPVY